MGFLDKWQPQLLSVLRIVSGLLFIEHGLTKIFHFPHLAMFDGPLPPMLVTAGVIELVAGALFTVGFYSRWAAFIMAGEMAVAYFVAHAPRGFFPVLNMGENAILFCFIFLYIAAAGPGPWAINRK
jgi:putative oxidoreductase